MRPCESAHGSEPLYNKLMTCLHAGSGVTGTLFGGIEFIDRSKFSVKFKDSYTLTGVKDCFEFAFPQITAAGKLESLTMWQASFVGSGKVVHLPAKATEFTWHSTGWDENGTLTGVETTLGSKCVLQQILCTASM